LADDAARLCACETVCAILGVDVCVMLCLVGDAGKPGRVGDAEKPPPAPLEFECEGPLLFWFEASPPALLVGECWCPSPFETVETGTKMYGFGELAIVPVQWSFKCKTQPF
jgi:hypothetical protein